MQALLCAGVRAQVAAADNARTACTLGRLSVLLKYSID
jgi:hypothetical protein